MAFSAVKPDADLYGLIPKAYAASLVASTGDPTADAINRLNLGMQSRRDVGNGGYESLIREANQYGMDAHRMEEQGKLDTAYIAQAPNLIKAGALGAIRPGANSGYLRDDVAIREADAAGLQAQAADNFNKVGTGVKPLTEAGVEVPKEYLRGLLTPPQARELIPEIKTGYMNPGDTSDRMKAQADVEQAHAATTRAKNGEGKADNKETTKTTYIVDKSGNRVPISTEVTVKGAHTPAAAVVSVQPKRITDPKTGKLIPNPAYKGP